MDWAFPFPIHDDFTENKVATPLQLQVTIISSFTMELHPLEENTLFPNVLNRSVIVCVSHPASALPTTPAKES